MCQFLEGDGGLRVVDAGDSLAPKDEITVNEGIVRRKKFECGDVIITTVLSLRYEWFLGKDMIKTFFALTQANVLGNWDA